MKMSPNKHAGMKPKMHPKQHALMGMISDLDKLSGAKPSGVPASKLQDQTEAHALAPEYNEDMGHSTKPEIDTPTPHENKMPSGVQKGDTEPQDGSVKHDSVAPGPDSDPDEKEEMRQYMLSKVGPRKSGGVASQAPAKKALKKF